MILIFKAASINSEHVWQSCPELKDMCRQPHATAKIISIHNLMYAYSYNQFQYIIVGVIEQSLREFISQALMERRAIQYVSPNAAS